MIYVLLYPNFFSFYFYIITIYYFVNFKNVYTKK